MCFERFDDEFRTKETLVTDTIREEELERPETWEPTPEPEEKREPEKVLEPV